MNFSGNQVSLFQLTFWSVLCFQITTDSLMNIDRSCNQAGMTQKSANCKWESDLATIEINIPWCSFVGLNLERGLGKIYTCITV